jgi:hypothetical protein
MDGIMTDPVAVERYNRLTAKEDPDPDETDIEMLRKHTMDTTKEIDESQSTGESSEKASSAQQVLSLNRSDN